MMSFRACSILHLKMTSFQPPNYLCHISGSIIPPCYKVWYFPFVACISGNLILPHYIYLALKNIVKYHGEGFPDGRQDTSVVETLHALESTAAHITGSHECWSPDPLYWVLLETAWFCVSRMISTSYADAHRSANGLSNHSYIAVNHRSPQVRSLFWRRWWTQPKTGWVEHQVCTCMMTCGVVLKLASPDLAAVEQGRIYWGAWHGIEIRVCLRQVQIPTPIPHYYSSRSRAAR